jgi:hypothetical protein
MPVRNVARAFLTGLDAPENLVEGEFFNLGSEELGATKSHIVKVLQAHWLDVQIEMRDLNFAGNMCSLLCFYKARKVLCPETPLRVKKK